MYRPLPEGLKIQNSGINGQGLFTMVFLKRDTDLGMSHFVINDNYKDKPKSDLLKLAAYLLNTSITPLMNNYYQQYIDMLIVYLY